MRRTKPMQEPAGKLNALTRIVRWMLPGLLVLLTRAMAGQRYTFFNYGLESGLANINVTALTETRAGVIWVGTQKGVFSLNGSRFEAHEEFTNAGIDGVWAMREDNEGRMWVLDGGHLVYRQGGVVRKIEGYKLHILSLKGVDLIRVPGEPDAIYVLHDLELQRIASVDHGITWAVSAAFAPELARRYPGLHALTSVVSGHGATVWAGCGKAICAVNLVQGTVREYGVKEGVAADVWTNFLMTRSGEVWVRGEHSVERLLPHASRFSKVTSVPQARFLALSTPVLLEDRNGRVVMNLDEGMVRTDGKSWQILSQRNGLPQDEIDWMLFDHTGTLWLAPSGRGISRWLGYGRWEGWTKADGLSSNIVLGIAEDEAGRRWVATEAGLDRVDGGTGRVTRLNNRAFNQLSAVVAHAGHVWTGDSLGRVVDYDSASGRTRVVLDHLDTVYQLVADKEDRIWVCSPQGLDYFGPSDRWSKPHHVGEPMLPKGNAYGISEGVAGVLWVMTEKGMYRLDGVGWSAVPLPVQAGPFYNLMTAAAADGTLWVQSRHPSTIVHLRVQGRAASVLSEFSDATMEAENLGFMGVDQRGWLWVESDRGVHVFNGQRWVRCNSEDGLLFDNPDYPAFLADSDGSVWIGTSGGLSHMLHPAAIFDAPEPGVALAEVRLGDSGLEEGVQGEFDLRRPPLGVRLLSTSYNRASATVYRYHLEGLESAWQETESSNLRFPALHPGNYTFRVAAVDRRLHESSAEHLVSFTVLEPWWNRRWFHVVEGVLAAALLLGFWRLSIRLLVMRQRELEAIVAARTRELEQEKLDLLNARAALIETTRRDTLTGLLNRAAIFERMSALCELSLTTGSTLAIVMADIDHFKRINDEHGHVVGDLAIRECADRIAQTIRPDDYVGRYGGEELLILMPGLDPSSSPARMEELRTAIAGRPIYRDALELRVTCSFGVAWMGGQRCALEVLVSIADEALYTAKKNGRNRVEFAANAGRGLREIDGVAPMPEVAV